MISSLTGDQFTVTNEGNRDAGPFLVTLASSTDQKHYEFGGLAAGQSETRSYGWGCESRQARADSQNQVAERNESNNTRDYVIDFC